MTATMQPAPVRGAVSRRSDHVAGATKVATVRRPAAAGFLESTGAVPVLFTSLVTLIILPMFIWAPESIPAELALLASSAVYLLGSQRLRRRERSGRLLIGLAAAAGLASIVAASATCHAVARAVDADPHVIPYCTAAFIVPGLVYLLALPLAWTRRVREYTA